MGLDEDAQTHGPTPAMVAASILEHRGDTAALTLLQINLINKSALSDEEKEKMLQITYFSYARTIASYVDSASKEFIEGAYGICHLYILKNCSKLKKFQKTYVVYPEKI
ncbi:Uncharacterised protein [Escherichia coli]|nr:transposase [Escherichia coli]SQO90156.1 Uncharacterised protein [Escherichia coli]